MKICEEPTRNYPGGRTGTDAGAQAHYRAGEKPCAACREGANWEAAFRSGRWNR